MPFSLDQVNLFFDSSQLLIVQYPFPTSLSISVKSLLGQLKPLFNTVLIILFGFFHYFFRLHLTTHYNYWIYETMLQSKPIKFNINLYTNPNSLLAKHAAHQKVESLRAASLSKIENTVNSNSIFNTKCPEFSA